MIAKRPERALRGILPKQLLDQQAPDKAGTSGDQYTLVAIKFHHRGGRDLALLRHRQLVVVARLCARSKIHPSRAVAGCCVWGSFVFSKTQAQGRRRPEACER